MQATEVALPIYATQFIYLGSKAIHDIEPMLLTGDSNHTIVSGHKNMQKVEHVQTIESMQVTDHSDNGVNAVDRGYSSNRHYAGHRCYIGHRHYIGHKDPAGSRYLRS